VKSNLRFLICLLISAQVLNWALLLSGFGHAHEGGCAPHQHPAISPVSQTDHSSRHCSEQIQFATTTNRECRSAHADFLGSTSHLHLNVLGVDFSVPQFAGSRPSEAVRVTASVPYCSAAGWHAGLSNLLSWDRLPQSIDGLAPDEAAFFRALSSQRTQCVLPSLCDCARHERSGVHLI
jgi:hypothetical protein